jgi:hypothetical protein
MEIDVDGIRVLHGEVGLVQVAPRCKYMGELVHWLAGRAEPLEVSLAKASPTDRYTLTFVCPMTIGKVVEAVPVPMVM